MSQTDSFTPMETQSSVEPTARSSIENLQLSSISWIDSIKYDYQADFMNFKLNSGRAYNSVVLIQAFSSAVKIGFMLSSPGGPLWAKIVMYGSAVVPVLGWTYTYLYRKYEFSDVIGWQGRRILILGNLCIILHSLFSGMTLLLWALNRDCDHPVCLPDFPEKVMPHGLLLQLFTGAVVMPMFYISHDSLAALVSFLTSFSLLLATAIILDMPKRDIASTLLISAMLLISLSIYEGSVRINYTLYSKFEKSLREQLASENKEYLLKLQTEEMRHMIGRCSADDTF